jgi:hypothetical protein
MLHVRWKAAAEWSFPILPTLKDGRQFVPFQWVGCIYSIMQPTFHLISEAGAELDNCLL